MNTIQTKGAYKIAQNLVEKGEDISSNNINNKIYWQYYHYLINLENKNNTITLKLMYIIFLYIRKFLPSFKDQKTITTG